MEITTIITITAIFITYSLHVLVKVTWSSSDSPKLLSIVHQPVCEQRESMPPHLTALLVEVKWLIPVTQHTHHNHNWSLYCLRVLRLYTKGHHSKTLPQMPRMATVTNGYHSKEFPEVFSSIIHCLPYLSVSSGIHLPDLWVLAVFHCSTKSPHQRQFLAFLIQLKQKMETFLQEAASGVIYYRRTRYNALGDSMKPTTLRIPKTVHPLGTG